MIDRWFGLILDAFDERELWDTTALVVCTDHGHYLGDVRDGRDIWGKPQVPQFEPLGHTPLLVAWPGVAGGGTCNALTTNVDLHATLADAFSVSSDHVTHGQSLVPLLTGEASLVREWALVADLGFSDLVLFVRTWDGAGWIAIAHVRPSTASTVFKDDPVGAFVPRSRAVAMERAMQSGQAVQLSGRDRHRNPAPHQISEPVEVVQDGV